jgi:pilus assembly protein CpaF
MFNVVVYQGEEVYLDFDVSHAETLIGKSDECHVELKGWNISRNHASFILSDDDIFIQDNGSMFGTYVNNERIKRHGPLKNVDVITIGGYTLSVVRHDGVPERLPDALQIDVQASAHRVKSGEPALERSGLDEFSQTRSPSEGKADASSTLTRAFDRFADEGARSPSKFPTVSVTKPARIIAEQQISAQMPGDLVVNKVPTIRPNRVRTEADLTFDEWRHFVHEAVLHEMDVRRIDANRMKDDELRANVRLIIREVIQAAKDLPKHIDQKELARQVLDEAVGLGPLEPLLADDSVTEIMVNRHDEIWIERKGQLYISEATFTSDAAVLGAIERIVSPLGRRIDESSPMVDARLKDGSRVNAIIHPLALRGPSLTIRKFAKTKITSQDYISYGSLTQEMVDLLIMIVQLRLNVIISGGTGTGKTSFLNMISSYVADDERIVTIEDAAELKLPQPNLVALESRPPNLEGKGAITIRDLVRNSLRMRPDRIIVGECRGGEALDMLQAMNTGHDGSMTTLHSNSPRDALARLEVLVLMAGMNLPVRAVDAIFLWCSKNYQHF